MLAPNQFYTVADNLLDAAHDSDWRCTNPESLRRAITAALQAAHAVPPGYVRVGDTNKRLLGTLPETADGCVAGVMAEVWEKDQVLPFPFKYGQSVIRIAECYSTPEVAAAAKEKA